MQNLRPFIAHAVTCTDSQLFCEHLPQWIQTT